MTSRPSAAEAVQPARLDAGRRPLTLVAGLGASRARQRSDVPLSTCWFSASSLRFSVCPSSGLLPASSASARLRLPASRQSRRLPFHRNALLCQVGDQPSTDCLADRSAVACLEVGQSALKLGGDRNGDDLHRCRHWFIRLLTNRDAMSTTIVRLTQQETFWRDRAGLEWEGPCALPNVAQEGCSMRQEGFWRRGVGRFTTSRLGTGSPPHPAPLHLPFFADPRPVTLGGRICARIFGKAEHQSPFRSEPLGAAQACPYFAHRETSHDCDLTLHCGGTLNRSGDTGGPTPARSLRTYRTKRWL
jgi:hypothetical protein